jgi:hypothetical protein
MNQTLLIIGGVISGICFLILLISGASKSTGGIVISVLGLLLGVGLLMAGIFVGDSSAPAPAPTPGPSGGAVGPAFNTIPGPITITGVQASKSSPGILISFSAGGDCQMCDAVFDLSMTYADGTTGTSEVSTSVSSGYIYAPYSPTNRALPPGQTQVTVTGFSTNPGVSGSQGPISAPYSITA